MPNAVLVSVGALLFFLAGIEVVFRYLALLASPTGRNHIGCSPISAHQTSGTVECLSIMTG